MNASLALQLPALQLAPAVARLQQALALLPPVDAFLADESGRVVWPPGPPPDAAAEAVRGAIARAAPVLVDGTCAAPVRTAGRRVVGAVALRGAVPEYVAALVAEGLSCALAEAAVDVLADEKLHAVVSSIRQGVLLVDRAGRLLEINPAARALFGIRSPEEAPRTLAEWTALFEARDADHNPLRPEDWPVARLMRGEEPPDAVLRLHRRDGSVPPFVGSVGVRRVLDRSGEWVLTLAVVQDITEQRRAEEALRRSEERFRRLSENSTIGIMISDQHGAIHYANQTVLKLLGYPAEEVEAGRLRWDRITPPEYLAHDEEALRQLQLTGACEPYEKIYIAADGRRIPVVLGPSVLDRLPDGTLVCAVYVLDMTPLRRAEEALLESEERFRTAVDSLPQFFVIYDPDRRIRFINAEGLRASGMTEAQLIGKRDEEAYPPDLVAGYLPTLQRAFQTHATQTCEWTQPARFGGRIHSVTCVPLLDERGGIRQVLAITHDVTGTKQAEETLREDDRRKNEFLGMLSHELRNPLAPMRSAVFVLERAPAGSPQAQRALAVMNRQVTHLARLVDDLLDVTRITRGKIQLQLDSLDLSALVRETAEDHRAVFEERRVELTLDLPEEPLRAEGDAVRLSQVLGNLLLNAAKFTPAGGQVAVTLRRTAPQRARLTVRDNGAGIEAHVLGRLFQPFTQADATLDRRHGGLGLGLAVVRGLVELHGGTVTAASEGRDLGAEFAVELPLGRDATPAAAREPGAAAKRRRVLVIEDNVDAAESLQDLLEMYGHELAVAHDGRRGIELARTFAPDVVLCDIGLPGMDGFDVARTLRADPVLRETCLVALTGYALPEDQKRVREAGFDHHFAKPPNLQRLEKLLASANPRAKAR